MLNTVLKQDGINIREAQTDVGAVYSVYDFIKACGAKQPRETWNRLAEQHTEVVTFCDNLKFPGAGQRETPVTTREGLLQILSLLPGTIGKRYREESAKLVLRYLDADPTLAEDIINRQTDPEQARKLALVAQSKATRLTYTQTLAEAGVSGIGFAQNTNALYDGLFGADAKGLRKQRNLPAKANVRKHMSNKELAATMLAEEIAIETIQDDCVRGTLATCRYSRNAGKKVRTVM